jgi:GntR family transcriptional repressor for pyruvate dehydrogenase complex
MTRKPTSRVLEIPAGATVAARRAASTLAAEPPKSLKLAEEAVLKIKEMIVSGRVRSGEKLPNERELSSELGISRNSLREAVRALSVMKILDVRQGDGTYVTSLSPDLLLEGIGLAADLLGDAWVVEAFEVRRLLEPAATALAAERATQEHIDALGAAVQAMEAATSSEELNESDIEFHRIVVQSTGNATLSSLIENVWGTTIRARVWRSIFDEGAVERTRDWHRLMFAAIVARDPEAAQAADLLHLTESERWLRRVLNERAEEEIAARNVADTDA